jgi:predicted nucleotidyltransferase
MAKTLEMVHGRVASNDILGMAYLRALKDSAIQPIAIQRTNGYHDEDIQHAISSATAIRRAVKEKKPISHTTPMAEDLQEGVFMEDYYPYLQTLLLSTPAEELKKRFLVDEGMEHMLQGNARKHMNYGSFLQACITQRYPRSSIQRSLTHILTHTDKQEIDSLPPCTFLRILAFNDTGRAYLRELKQKEIAIASAFHQIPKEHREIFLRTTAAYACAFPLSRRKEVMDSELRSPMYITS